MNKLQLKRHADAPAGSPGFNDDICQSKMLFLIDDHRFAPTKIDARTSACSLLEVHNFAMVKNTVRPFHNSTPFAFFSKPPRLAGSFDFTFLFQTIQSSFSLVLTFLNSKSPQPSLSRALISPSSCFPRSSRPYSPFPS